MTDRERDLHPLEERLLAYLDGRGPATETGILQGGGVPDEGSLRRAAQWLLGRGLIRETDRKVRRRLTAGPLGEACLEAETTPELALLERVREGCRDIREVQEDDRRFDRARWGSAMGALLRAGLLRRGPEGLEAAGGAGPFEDVWELVYAPLSRGETVDPDRLPPEVLAVVEARAPRRGRGRAEFLLEERTEVTLDITPSGRGELESARERGVAVGALTREMLASGSWRDVRFRRYEMDIPPSRLHAGRLHPYGQFLEAVRRRFVSLGFTEMEGSIAESEFWNNDALFMPQFHPARDIHDVYYLGGGAKVPPPRSDLEERVAAAHRDGGGTGGRGWGYDFSRERTRTAVLRSQGTALSARTLASDPAVPGKYFGVARCFRYDQVDATHLPDFYQIEGIVLGEGIDLRHLLGLLRLFAEEIAGAEDYKFLPSYFPFTEPSVEMHIRHPRLGWVEGGGAGLFRPEVTRPLGVEVPVIAWGLGLDRMAMLAMGISDIRDLVTPDLSRLRETVVMPDRLLAGKGERDA